MPVHDQQIYQGQFYEFVGFRPHVCRDGREIELEVWQSHCATCGAPFSFSRPGNSQKPFAPNRRCAAHKARGVKVGSRADTAALTASSSTRAPALPDARRGADH